MLEIFRFVKHWDANADGHISLDEFMTFAADPVEQGQEVFESWDQDEDGELSVHEIVNAQLELLGGVPLSRGSAEPG